MGAFLLCTLLQQAVSAAPKGGGICTTALDCQLAGECKDGKCSCDPGWTGGLCSMLDLAPLKPGSGDAWNAENSPRSSWGVAPLQDTNGTYHGWFNQLPDVCGLSSWLPGSNIVHGISNSPLGPFKEAKDATPTAQRDPLSQFATNPQIIYISAEKRYVLYINGRQWAPNDLTKCEPNKTGLAPWHGGGPCSGDNDCPGAFHGTDHAQTPGKCDGGKCACEHHSFGLHCDQITETVNIAHSTSPYGPWTQLLPDGAAFWSDSDQPNGSATTRADPTNPDGGKAASNPSAFVLPNGTIVLAYSRAPGTGISVAPSWKGPYKRLSLPTNASSRYPIGKNYSLVGCGEDPFLYQDFRGTWRVLCHGKNIAPDASGFKAETVGMAFSTDLLHWTAGPGPAATSTMTYTNGSTRNFAKRERPALLLDAKGFPLVLYNGVQAEEASYSCHSATDRACHCWSFAQATHHGEQQEFRA
jgi:hypothetical protein